VLAHDYQLAILLNGNALGSILLSACTEAERSDTIAIKGCVKIAFGGNCSLLG
jgi:hypothetical protein